MVRGASDLRSGAVLAALVVGFSSVVSVGNLAGSLRVLDLTGSSLMLSVAVLTYNAAFTVTSWVWPYVLLGRLSRRGVVITSALGNASGLALMGLSPHPALVIVGSGITGLSFALMSPVMITVLSDYFGKDSLAVTKYNTYSSLGIMVGYVAAALARYSLPTAALLTASALTSVGLALLALAMPQRYVVVEPRRPTYVPLIPQLTGRLRPFPLAIPSPKLLQNLSKVPAGLARLVRRFAGRKLPLTYLATATFFTAISLFFTPLPALLRLLGFSDSEMYLTYLVPAAVSTVSYRLVHPLISEGDRAWDLLIAAVATRVVIFLTPVYVLVLNAPAKLTVLASFVAIGLTWAAISSSLTAVVLSMSESERRDERLGQLNAMIGLGTVLGSLIAGPVTQYYGYVAASAASSILTLVAVATYVKAKGAVVT